jgi:hypothetical protein
MSDEPVRVEMALRWWVMPYLAVLYWFAMLMGTRPKDTHVEWILTRGARWTQGP